MNTATPFTEKTLQSIVANRLKVDSEQVPLDKSLRELGLDSFKVIEIIMEIDHVFAPVTISNKTAGELRTLQDVATYIDHELGRI